VIIKPNRTPSVGPIGYSCVSSQDKGGELGVGLVTQLVKKLATETVTILNTRHPFEEDGRD
jgi:hypothetical protein